MFGYLTSWPYLLLESAKRTLVLAEPAFQSHSHLFSKRAVLLYSLDISRRATGLLEGLTTAAAAQPKPVEQMQSTVR